jgi:Protein of unknown function (DUF4238)
MPTRPTQIKRRNHTVNESYLRCFANGNGFLAGIKLPGEERFPISVGDATVRKNFYVVRLPDGSESDQAEDDFGQVESNAAVAIRTLIDDRVWPIPGEVRTRIAEWAALQYLRVPWVRQFAREIARALSEVGLPIPEGSGERSTIFMPADQVDRHGAPAFHIEFIRRQAAVVAEMLYERDWVLTFYNRRSLATSDAPVVLRPMIRYPDGTTVAVGNAAQIQVPLDRRVALSMLSRKRGDERVRGVTKTAVDLNKATVGNARRYIFHHPDDDPLNGLELPQPRERELASPEDAAALVAELFDSTAQ